MLFKPFVKDVIRLANGHMCSTGLGQKYKTIPKVHNNFRFINFNPRKILGSYNRNKKIDIVVLFEELPQSGYNELQQILKPDGYMLILDPKSPFKMVKRFLPGESMLKNTAILMEHQQVQVITK